jgi:hypothetical protein
MRRCIVSLISYNEAYVKKEKTASCFYRHAAE